MLKQIIKTEEFFYDIEAEVSSVPGALKRGVYKRVLFSGGFAWFESKKGIDITEFSAGKLLEEKYQEHQEHLKNEEIQRVEQIKKAFS